MLFFKFLCLLYLMVLSNCHTISKSIATYDHLGDVVDCVNDFEYTAKCGRHAKNSKNRLIQPSDDLTLEPQAKPIPEKTTTVRTTWTTTKQIPTTKKPTKMGFWEKLKHSFMKPKKKSRRNEDRKENKPVVRRHHQGTTLVGRSRRYVFSLSTPTAYENHRIEKYTPSYSRNNAQKLLSHNGNATEPKTESSPIFHQSSMATAIPNQTQPHNVMQKQQNKNDDEPAMNVASLEELLKKVKSNSYNYLWEQDSYISDIILNSVTETTFATSPLVDEPNYFYEFTPNPTVPKDIANLVAESTVSAAHNLHHRNIKQKLENIGGDIDSAIKYAIAKGKCELKKGEETVKRVTKGMMNKTAMELRALADRLQCVGSPRDNEPKATQENDKLESGPDLHAVLSKNDLKDTLSKWYDKTNLNLLKTLVTKIHNDMASSEKSMHDDLQSINIQSHSTEPNLSSLLKEDLTMFKNFEKMLKTTNEPTHLNIISKKASTEISFHSKHPQILADYNLNNNEQLSGDADNSEYEEEKAANTPPIRRPEALYDDVPDDAELAVVTDDSLLGLSSKLHYNEFVNGYKYYLNFAKKLNEDNFSAQVRYQAHKHHSVDDIGKYILDKLPVVNTNTVRNKRFYFDNSDSKDQDITAKGEDSWFKRYFKVPSDPVKQKKFHTTQTVTLGNPDEKIKTIKSPLLSHVIRSTLGANDVDDRKSSSKYTSPSTTKPDDMDIDDIILNLDSGLKKNRESSEHTSISYLTTIAPGLENSETVHEDDHLNTLSGVSKRFAINPKKLLNLIGWSKVGKDKNKSNSKKKLVSTQNPDFANPINNVTYVKPEGNKGAVDAEKPVTRVRRGEYQNGIYKRYPYTMRSQVFRHKTTVPVGFESDLVALKNEDPVAKSGYVSFNLISKPETKKKKKKKTIFKYLFGKPPPKVTSAAPKHKRESKVKSDGPIKKLRNMFSFFKKPDSDEDYLHFVNAFTLKQSVDRPNFNLKPVPKLTGAEIKSIDDLLRNYDLFPTKKTTSNNLESDSVQYAKAFPFQLNKGTVGKDTDATHYIKSLPLAILIATTKSIEYEPDFEETNPNMRVTTFGMKYYNLSVPYENENLSTKVVPFLVPDGNINSNAENKIVSFMERPFTIHNYYTSKPNRNSGFEDHTPRPSIKLAPLSMSPSPLGLYDSKYMFTNKPDDDDMYANTLNFFMRSPQQDSLNILSLFTGTPFVASFKDETSRSTRPFHRPTNSPITNTKDIETNPLISEDNFKAANDLLILKHITSPYSFVHNIETARPPILEYLLHSNNIQNGNLSGIESCLSEINRYLQSIIHHGSTKSTVHIKENSDSNKPNVFDEGPNDGLRKHKNLKYHKKGGHRKDKANIVTSNILEKKKHRYRNHTSHVHPKNKTKVVKQHKDGSGELYNQYNDLIKEYNKLKYQYHKNMLHKYTQEEKSAHQHKGAQNTKVHSKKPTHYTDTIDISYDNKVSEKFQPTQYHQEPNVFISQPLAYVMGEKRKQFNLHVVNNTLGEVDFNNVISATGKHYDWPHPIHMQFSKNLHFGDIDVKVHPISQSTQKTTTTSKYTSTSQEDAGKDLLESDDETDDINYMLNMDNERIPSPVMMMITENVLTRPSLRLTNRDLLSHMDFFTTRHANDLKTKMKVITLPDQYFATPLPMKSTDFTQFLKDHQIDIADVTSPLHEIDKFESEWLKRKKSQSVLMDVTTPSNVTTANTFTETVTILDKDYLTNDFNDYKAVNDDNYNEHDEKIIVNYFDTNKRRRYSNVLKKKPKSRLSSIDYFDTNKRRRYSNVLKKKPKSRLASIDPKADFGITIIDINDIQDINDIEDDRRPLESNNNIVRDKKLDFSAPIKQSVFEERYQPFNDHKLKPGIKIDEAYDGDRKVASFHHSFSTNSIKPVAESQENENVYPEVVYSDTQEDKVGKLDEKFKFPNDRIISLFSRPNDVKIDSARVGTKNNNKAAKDPLATSKPKLNGNMSVNELQEPDRRAEDMIMKFANAAAEYTLKPTEDTFEDLNEIMRLRKKPKKVIFSSNTAKYEVLYDDSAIPDFFEAFKSTIDDTKKASKQPVKVEGRVNDNYRYERDWDRFQSQQFELRPQIFITRQKKDFIEDQPLNEAREGRKATTPRTKKQDRFLSRVLQRLRGRKDQRKPVYLISESETWAPGSTDLRGLYGRLQRSANPMGTRSSKSPVKATEDSTVLPSSTKHHKHRLRMFHKKHHQREINDSFEVNSDITDAPILFASVIDTETTESLFTQSNSTSIQNHHESASGIVNFFTAEGKKASGLLERLGFLRKVTTTRRIKPTKTSELKPKVTQYFPNVRTMVNFDLHCNTLNILPANRMSSMMNEKMEQTPKVPQSFVSQKSHPSAPIIANIKFINEKSSIGNKSAHETSANLVSLQASTSYTVAMKPADAIKIELTQPLQSPLVVLNNAAAAVQKIIDNNKTSTVKSITSNMSTLATKESAIADSTGSHKTKLFKGKTHSRESCIKDLYRMLHFWTPTGSMPTTENVKRTVHKRDAQSVYTAKNVASLEVLVDFIDVRNSCMTVTDLNTTENPQNEPMNSIQIHISVPYELIDNKKRAVTSNLKKMRKVFAARMLSPVNIEYEVRSDLLDNSRIQEPKLNVASVKPALTAGLYLLIPNNQPNDEILSYLQPIKKSCRKNRNLVKNEATTADPKAGKVTLTKDFIKTVNEQLLKLYTKLHDLTDEERVHHVRKRSTDSFHLVEENNKRATSQRTWRTINWDWLKNKLNQNPYACKCTFTPNHPMCRACAASDAVIKELIFEFDNLDSYIADHCTEIQTFFRMNPTGGKKLKEIIRKIQSSLEAYAKRTKGKCRGRPCSYFEMAKREFTVPNYGEEFKWETVTNKLQNLDFALLKAKEYALCGNSENLKRAARNLVNTTQECAFQKQNPRYKTHITSQLMSKNLSLDKINVNIYCYTDHPDTSRINDFVDSISSTISQNLLFNLKSFDEDETAYTTKKSFAQYLYKSVNLKNNRKRESPQIESPKLATIINDIWLDNLDGIVSRNDTDNILSPNFTSKPNKDSIISLRYDEADLKKKLELLQSVLKNEQKILHGSTIQRDGETSTSSTNLWDVKTEDYYASSVGHELINDINDVFDKDSFNSTRKHLKLLPGFTLDDLWPFGSVYSKKKTIPKKDVPKKDGSKIDDPEMRCEYVKQTSHKVTNTDETHVVEVFSDRLPFKFKTVSTLPPPDNIKYVTKKRIRSQWATKNLKKMRKPHKSVYESIKLLFTKINCGCKTATKAEEDNSTGTPPLYSIIPTKLIITPRTKTYHFRKSLKTYAPKRIMIFPGTNIKMLQSGARNQEAMAASPQQSDDILQSAEDNTPLVYSQHNKDEKKRADDSKNKRVIKGFESSNNDSETFQTIDSLYKFIKINSPQSESSPDKEIQNEDLENELEKEQKSLEKGTKKENVETSKKDNYFNQVNEDSSKKYLQEEMNSLEKEIETSMKDDNLDQTGKQNELDEIVNKYQEKGFESPYHTEKQNKFDKTPDQIDETAKKTFSEKTFHESHKKESYWDKLVKIVKELSGNHSSIKIGPSYNSLEIETGTKDTTIKGVSDKQTTETADTFDINGNTEKFLSQNVLNISVYAKKSDKMDKIPSNGDSYILDIVFTGKPGQKIIPVEASTMCYSSTNVTKKEKLKEKPILVKKGSVTEGSGTDINDNGKSSMMTKDVTNSDNNYHKLFVGLFSAGSLTAFTMNSKITDESNLNESDLMMEGFNVGWNDIDFKQNQNKLEMHEESTPVKLFDVKDKRRSNDSLMFNENIQSYDNGSVVLPNELTKEELPKSKLPADMYTIIGVDKAKAEKTILQDLKSLFRRQHSNKVQKNQASHVKALRPRRVCDVGATARRVMRARRLMPDPDFERFVVDIPCYRYKNLPRQFVVRRGPKVHKTRQYVRNFDVPSKTVVNWDWIRRKRSLMSVNDDYDIYDRNRQDRNIYYRNINNKHKSFNKQTSKKWTPIWLPKIRSGLQTARSSGTKEEFEVLYKGEDHVYRKAKERQKRKAGDMNLGLKNLPPLRPSQDERYVMIGDGVKIECVASNGRNVKPSSDDVSVQWLTERADMLDADNLNVNGTTLTLDNVGAGNVGNYTCSQAGNVVRVVRLTLVEMPTFHIVFMPMYTSSNGCSYDDLRSIGNLGPLMSKSFSCGHDTVRIREPVCLSDKDNSSMAHVMAVAVLRACPLPKVRCSAQCERDLHCSLALLRAANALSLSAVDVVLSKADSNKTLVPTVTSNKKLIITHTMRKKDVSDEMRFHHLAASLSPGDVALEASCPPGFYLMPEYKICAVCPADTFSAGGGGGLCAACAEGTSAPPGARRCRAHARARTRSLTCWFDCDMVKMAWYAGLALTLSACAAGLCYRKQDSESPSCKDMTTPEQIQHVFTRSRVPTMVGPKRACCASATGVASSRRLSPSAVILARFFHPSTSSSKAEYLPESRESRFEQWKERNIPPSPPPVDFDVVSQS